MLTFDLTPLAKRLNCLPELEAARGKDLSRVGWLFLGTMLREMPVPDAETKAVVDPVIAGMDRLARGEYWPEALAWAAADAAGALIWCRSAATAEWAAATAAAMAAWATAWAARAAALAAFYANAAGIPYARQREILVRLMEEATDAERTDR